MTPFRLPVAGLADQLGNAKLDRLIDGVAFPGHASDVTISSARTTAGGLELEAEVAMWG